jgi:NAD(P)-dependent dehydrogenase (short-subunit alcohol dehydrogenase family)
MDRDVALLTGGNSGIGRVAAHALARAGWRVAIASRNRAASAEAVRSIERQSGAGAAEALGVDLASPASVRALAKEVAERGLAPRALVLNAGLQLNRGPVRSEEGYELTFAANHLGHFLLANLLVERLAPGARIVVVSSGVHDPAQRTGMPKAAIRDLDVLAATGGPERDRYDGRLAYVNSKLCNLWFAYELDRRLSVWCASTGRARITVNGWEPGLVPASGLARDYPGAARFVWNWILPGLARAVHPFLPGFSTLSLSGNDLARMVLDPSLAGVTGKYFPSTARWREARSSVDSYDAERAAELWRASVRMTGLAASESPLARA